MSRKTITSVVNEYAFITYEKDICNMCGKEKNCITFNNSDGMNDPCAICQDCCIKIFYKYAEIEVIKDEVD